MKRQLILLAFGSLALGLMAQATTPSSAAEEAAIKAARVSQNAAIVDLRVDEIASFWTEDVTIRRGLGGQSSGKAAYRKLFADDASTAERIVYQREPSSIEVSLRWPLAFETGTWRGYRGRLNGPVIISGRYSAHWVKRGENWLIRSEVFVALDAEDSGRELKAVP